MSPGAIGIYHGIRGNSTNMRYDLLHWDPSICACLWMPKVALASLGVIRQSLQRSQAIEMPVTRTRGKCKVSGPRYLNLPYIADGCSVQIGAQEETKRTGSLVGRSALKLPSTILPIGSRSATLRTLIQARTTSSQHMSRRCH